MSNIYPPHFDHSLGAKIDARMSRAEGGPAEPPRDWYGGNVANASQQSTDLLHKLAETQSETERLLSELGARLSTVLLPAGANTAPGAEKCEPVRSPLSETVARRIGDAERQNGFVRFLLDHLTI